MLNIRIILKIIYLVQHLFCQCGNWPSALWYRESAQTFYTKKNLKPELIIFYCCRHIWPPILNQTATGAGFTQLYNLGEFSQRQANSIRTPSQQWSSTRQSSREFHSQSCCQVEWKQGCSHNFFCFFEGAIMIGPYQQFFWNIGIAPNKAPPWRPSVAI